MEKNIDAGGGKLNSSISGARKQWGTMNQVKKVREKDRIFNQPV